jgi:hypothetical protein
LYSKDDFVFDELEFNDDNAAQVTITSNIINRKCQYGNKSHITFNKPTYPGSAGGTHVVDGLLFAVIG